MSLDALFKQANAAQLAGDWAKAERLYKGLTKLKPSWAWHNLAVLYVASARLSEAEPAFRAALQAEPGLAEARRGLGMLLLRLGRYEEGWPLFEARRFVAGSKAPRPRVAYPEWDGGDLSGRHLVVVPEQGLGDQIMLARFMPELRRRAAKVTFLCAPELAPLFNAAGIEATPVITGERYPAADCWTLLFSIPGRLGVTPETLDGRAYLNLPGEGAAQGVGVKTFGSPTHLNDRNRSLPPAAAAQLAALGRDLDPKSTGAADFLETARIIAGLEVVVSVDTSVVHLAAAMGKPAWVLTPFVETDWRWGDRIETTPWYDSVRLFRQGPDRKWGPVIERVAQELARRPAG
jgi:hypothetical protein